MAHEAYRAAVGDYLVRFRFGPVTEDQILAYADVSKDYNPMHVDPVFARDRGLPSVVAHGPLLAGVLSGEIAQRIGPDVLRSLHLQFVSPTFVGDELLLTVRVVEEVGQPGDTVFLCHVSVMTGDAVMRAEGTMTVASPVGSVSSAIRN